MNFEARRFQASENKILFIVLKICCFSVFTGRAWEHLRWDPPYRSLFWDQQLLESLIQKFTGLSWIEYASSAVVDNMIQNFTVSVGWFYILCAVASLIITNRINLVYRICKHIIIAGSIGLIFLAFLYCKERFFELGQFFEYTAQFSSPLVLLYSVSDFSKKRLKLFFKVAISLTFICHGLYAINFYPTHGNWIDMFILAFDISEQSATNLLYFAGINDIIFSVLIFIPGLIRPACIYLFLWGFLTSVARIYTNLYIDSASVLIEGYLHEVIYRFPHFLFPLLLFLLNLKDKYFGLNRSKALV